MIVIIISISGSGDPEGISFGHFLVVRVSDGDISIADVSRRSNIKSGSDQFGTDTDNVRNYNARTEADGDVAPEVLAGDTYVHMRPDASPVRVDASDFRSFTLFDFKTPALCVTLAV